ncbi:hypothetical protein E4H12_14785 [Candidatus Thorarchaeota archaeon]|nr:MAG: hypothetical protein E4H12_14785 [Candidatus Thorarchaeota archaeon]
MTSREQTFRVFRCPHCGYTGYRQVSNPEDDSKCNLCSKTISHTSDMRYVTSSEDARKAMQEIIFSSHTRAPTKTRHGLGVKKRLFYMVSDLSDLNNGRGVSRSRVLEECQEVDIEIDKAERFLNQLQEEGQIIEIDDKLTVM